jgi:hypothetical protein
MAQPHFALRRAVYFCWFSAGLLIVVLMTYMGLFDGVGDALYELLKPIAKFFFQ